MTCCDYGTAVQRSGLLLSGASACECMPGGCARSSVGHVSLVTAFATLHANCTANNSSAWQRSAQERLSDMTHTCVAD